jgi:predicted RecA/RadA family phage recombinase
MSHVQRFRHMDPRGTIKLPVAAATVIDVGDMCYYDAAVDQVKPNSAQADQTSLILNQQLWKDNFAGVAMTASAAGETDDVTLATEGVFEFDCAATAWDAFALVGADEDAGIPGVGSNSRVIAAAAQTDAIGRVWRKYTANTTKVLVRISGNRNTNTV